MSLFDGEEEGDMNTEQMNELRKRITTDWTVNIVDHECLNNSRDNVEIREVTKDAIVMRPGKMWASQGRKFSTMTFTWSGELELDGLRVHIFRTPAPHTGKSRRCVKTFEFIPPKR